MDSGSNGGSRFYSDLARYWPLISPVEGYAEEAAEIARVFAHAAPGATSLLELGSGGGHNAFYLKEKYALTLTDLSDEMLDVSRRLNPECEHIRGDMRSLSLGRSFDLVLVHDAIDYMLDEAALDQAISTAYRHCRPGGVALFIPDAVKETFEPGTECGGSDGDAGEGVRYLEWSYDPDPDDTVGTTHYTFLVRGSDGSVSSSTETHLFGIFPRATWQRLVARVGFEVSVVVEQTTEDRTPRAMFLGRRSAG